MSVTEVRLMDDEPFTITVSREGSDVIVAVDGALDPETSLTLRNILSDLVESQGNLSLAVDLSAAVFLDSTAIGVICALERELSSRNGHLVVREPDAAVRQIFETSGLASILVPSTS